MYMHVTRKMIACVHADHNNVARVTGYATILKLEAPRVPSSTAWSHHMDSCLAGLALIESLHHSQRHAPLVGSSQGLYRHPSLL